MTLLDHATATARGAMPRVNLLPPEIEEHRRFSRLRLVLFGTLVWTSAGVGGLYLFTDQATRQAAAELQAEQDRGSTVSGESAQYAAVPQLENETRAAETSLQTAMSHEVRWSFFLNELSAAMPADAWLTSLTMTQPLDAASPDAGASVAPYANPGIASVTYAGIGRTYPAVAAWLEAQEAIAISDDPYATNTASTKIGGTEVVDFATTAVINERAYSHRFDSPQEIRP